MAKGDPEKKLRDFLTKLQAEGVLKLSAAQKPSFNVARERGFAEECPNPNPPKKAPKNPPIFAKLTPAGATWLIEHVIAEHSPKAALHELSSVLTAQLEAFTNRPSSETNFANRIDALASQLEQLRNDITQSSAKRSEELKVLSHALVVTQSTATKAVQDLEQLVQGSHVVATPPAAASAPTPAATPPKLDAEVVRFVETYWEDHRRSCTVEELKNYLDGIAAPLTTGQYHDLLRTMHRAGTISLSNWARMLTDIPKPELALFLSDKVMYYVGPRDRSI